MEEFQNGTRVVALWCPDGKLPTEIKFAQCAKISTTTDIGWYHGSIISQINETYVSLIWDKTRKTSTIAREYVQGWFSVDQVDEEKLPLVGTEVEVYVEHGWVPGVVTDLLRLRMIISYGENESVSLNIRNDLMNQKQLGRLRPRQRRSPPCYLKISQSSAAPRKRPRSSSRSSSTKEKKYQLGQRVVARWGAYAESNGWKNTDLGDTKAPQLGRICRIDDESCTIWVQFDKRHDRRGKFTHYFDQDAQYFVRPWFQNIEDDEQRPEPNSSVFFNKERAQVVSRNLGGQLSLKSLESQEDITLLAKEILDGRLEPLEEEVCDGNYDLPPYLKVGNKVNVLKEGSWRTGEVLQHGLSGSVLFKVDGEFEFLLFKELFLKTGAYTENDHMLQTSYSYAEIEKLIEELIKSKVDFQERTFGVTRNRYDDNSARAYERNVERLLEALCRLDDLQALVKKINFCFESIQINMTRVGEQPKLRLHKHPYNSECSAIFAVGDYNHDEGGHLEVLTPSQNGGAPYTSKKYDIWRKLTVFNGCRPHRPCEFHSGWRCSIVFYTRLDSNCEPFILKESNQRQTYLRELGFPLPTKKNYDVEATSEFEDMQQDDDFYDFFVDEPVASLNILSSSSQQQQQDDEINPASLSSQDDDSDDDETPLKFPKF